MNGKEEQILRSKTKIINAMFELLKTNTFDELTLNEILDEAMVSRRTFYRYFTNKQDILNYYYNDFIAKYRLLEETILKQRSLNGVILVTLNYFYQNQPELALLIKNQKFHLLLEKFNQVAFSIYRSINAPWHLKEEALSPNIGDSLYFIIGGYSNVISHWLSEDEPRTPKEIAQNINTYFGNIFENLVTESE